MKRAGNAVDRMTVDEIDVQALAWGLATTLKTLGKCVSSRSDADGCKCRSQKRDTCTCVVTTCNVRVPNMLGTKRLSLTLLRSRKTT